MDFARGEQWAGWRRLVSNFLRCQPGWKLGQKAKRCGISLGLGCLGSLSYLGRLIWRPDSNAFFFRHSRSLYFVSVPDGRPVLVDQYVAVAEWDDYNNFVWIK